MDDDKSFNNTNTNTNTKNNNNKSSKCSEFEREFFEKFSSVFEFLKSQATELNDTFKSNIDNFGQDNGIKNSQKQKLKHKSQNIELDNALKEKIESQNIENTKNSVNTV